MPKTIRLSDKIFNTAHPADSEWWRTGVIYQIYPRSFQDTNGDGIGDLKGIEQRLPYLRDLGVDAIWISPFFRSPMADFGYDVSDYCDVDPIFGTMDDFDSMLASAHELGIRVLVDYVPNHTSDQHPWFLESRASRDHPKRDWYIWRDAKPDGSPPDNLVSFFAGPAWTWDEATEQYYLHMFLKEQPDLNWRNPDVAEAMYDVLHFWLRKGVDGFRLDAITTLIKGEGFMGLPEEARNLTGLDLLLELKGIHNHPDLHPILKQFRAILDSYDHQPVLIAETNAADFEELSGFYGDDYDEIQLPMNLQTLHLPWDAPAMRASITAYYEGLPALAMPNFVFGNHDQSRLANRFGVANVRSAIMLLLTVWGVPTLYYGDELGMVDGRIEAQQRQDPFAGDGENAGMGRDPERTPMQWDDSPNAGFTAADVAPWLPVNTTFTGNVAAQLGDERSTLAFTKRLLHLRAQSAALKAGSIQFVESAQRDLLMYLRQAGDERLLVIINFGEETAQLDLSTLGDHAVVLLTSAAAAPPAVVPAVVKEGIITLMPHESQVVRL